MMPTYKLKLIRDYNPDMKIIILLRNPVERAWSQAIMNFQRFHNISYEGNEDLYEKFLFSKKSLNMGYYAKHLKRWQSVFSREQVFIGLYEQLKEDPEQLFSDIVKFLDASQSINPELVFKEKVNPNPPSEIPAKIVEKLSSRFKKDIHILIKKHKMPVEHWLK